MFSSVLGKKVAFMLDHFKQYLEDCSLESLKALRSINLVAQGKILVFGERGRAPDGDIKGN